MSAESSVNEVMVVEQSTTPSTSMQPLQPVDVEAAEAFMNNYQDLVKSLLDDTDYQDIYTKEGIKKSKKKSAWRKLATAFNISDDVVEKEIIRDDCQRIISARYEVIATLPNGRHGVGTGSASIFDKIKNDDAKEPTPFELRKRFTNAEHDIISTAHTRAKSRAISDLIGAGEVSAEELEGLSGKPKVKPKGPKPTKPKTNGQTSNLGYKPKAPKTPKAPKPVTDNDEAIEVEVVKPKKTAKKPNLKEIIDSNSAIRLAVDEIQGQDGTVDRPHIQDKLLDLMDMGKVTPDEYKEAKALLE